MSSQQPKLGKKKKKNAVCVCVVGKEWKDTWLAFLFLEIELEGARIGLSWQRERVRRRRIGNDLAECFLADDLPSQERVRYRGYIHNQIIIIHSE